MSGTCRSGAARKPAACSDSSFTPPKPDRPEANGHRVMFSPAKERSNDVFLTVMTKCDEQEEQLPVDLVELPQAFVVTLADRLNPSFLPLHAVKTVAGTVP